MAVMQELTNIADVPGDILDNVALNKVSLKNIIGTGTFSAVHEVGVLFFSGDGKESICAAKKLRIEGDKKSYLDRMKRVCNAYWKPGKERKVEHPNLVRFVGIWFRPEVDSDLPWIVSEKMDISLTSYIAKPNREMPSRLNILRDVANGLEYLHESCIVHGDLTANSVFIRSEDSPSAKIGDLGISNILDKGACPTCSSYKSPEAYNNTNEPCAATDIYAFGVMIMHTLLQDYPIENQRYGDPGRFSACLERLTVTCKDKHQAVSECVAECLHLNPDERPPATLVFRVLDRDGASAISLEDLKTLVKNEASTKEKLEKRAKIKSPEQLSIMITGKTGSGKSSLVNGLIGTEVTVEGHKLTSSTKEVSGYQFYHKRVPFFVVDSPGLQDHKMDDKVTLEMIRKELISKCQSFDLVIYCVDMTSKRVEASDKTAILHLTECFGEKFWKNAVFILTFANQAQPLLSYQGDDDVKWFSDKLDEFQKLLHECLIEAEVCKEIVDEVPIIPAGYWKVARKLLNPWNLPDRPDWFNVFWISCALRMEGRASVAMFKSQATRISNKPLTEIEGTAIERQIYVPPEYVPEKDPMGIEIPRVRVVAGSFIGTVIGGGVGALFGIPGGPIGIAVVAVAGAATGAAIGGTVSAAIAAASQHKL